MNSSPATATATVAAEQTTLRQRVIAEQVRAHYSQIPAMVIAPTLGGLFTAWVLWNAVQNTYLVIGMSTVIVFSAARLVLYRAYFKSPPARAGDRRWKLFAVAASFVSGCIWGSAAPFLYPPHSPGYEVYLLVLLTLLPIVPVAALAVYMPAFYAYYVPCIAPFVVALAVGGSWPEQMTAVLLLMMMGAMVTFARRYSNGLAEAVQLKLQLAEKTVALEQAIQHKSRFIAAASHDLRQPVHAMGLFMESLHDGNSSAARTEGVAYIEASLKTLRGMLNDLLEISQLDANVVRVHARDFSPAAMLQKLRDEYMPLTARRQLEFRYLVRDCVVHSDPALLERMLRNLLSNALKFTSHGGLALVCRGRGSTVLLQVFDTGTGIRAQHLSQVFEEFSQLDNPERDEAKGLGLGLAIVERMAGLLGHELRVRSVFGRGSAFTVEVAQGRGPVAEPQHRAPAAGDTALGSRRVLVVDDDEAVGAGTAALVRQWGHRVTVARSAAQALAVWPDGAGGAELLIVDYRLGEGQTGFDAIALLEGRWGRRLPSIIVTGDSEPQLAQQSYAAGHALLHKPVDPERLRACMAVMCPPAAASLPA